MRQGVTLIELLVVMTLMGVMLGVAAVNLRTPPRTSAPAGDGISRLRMRAVRDGVPQLAGDSSGNPVLLLPDGRVVRAASMAGGGDT